MGEEIRENKSKKITKIMEINHKEKDELEK